MTSKSAFFAELPASRHAVFFRGFPGDMDGTRIKRYLEEQISECEQQFVKRTPDGTQLLIAFRFPTHELAQECLKRFHDTVVLGFPVKAFPYKDIRGYYEAQRSSHGDIYTSRGGYGGYRRGGNYGYQQLHYSQHPVQRGGGSYYNRSQCSGSPDSAFDAPPRRHSYPNGRVASSGFHAPSANRHTASHHYSRSPKSDNSGHRSSPFSPASRSSSSPEPAKKRSKSKQNKHSRRRSDSRSSGELSSASEDDSPAKKRSKHERSESPVGSDKDGSVSNDRAGETGPQPQHQPSSKFINFKIQARPDASQNYTSNERDCSSSSPVDHFLDDPKINLEAKSGGQTSAVTVFDRRNGGLQVSAIAKKAIKADRAKKIAALSVEQQAMINEKKRFLDETFKDDSETIEVVVKLMIAEAPALEDHLRAITGRVLQGLKDKMAQESDNYIDSLLRTK